MFVIPEDIADRLLFKKKHWFHGLPKITLEGNYGSFCQLRFDFKDEIISFLVYVANKHRHNQILDAAHFAVTNFAKFDHREYKFDGSELEFNIDKPKLAS